MEIKRLNENKESVYELVYNKDNLEGIIYNCIKNCSIRVRGRFTIEAHTKYEAEFLIKTTVDYIGNKVYKNVSDIRIETHNDEENYWKQGNYNLYSFEADALVSPKLVSFLISLKQGKEITYGKYEWFKERKELSEKTKLAMEINAKDYEINLISNYDTDRKIQKINELASLMDKLKCIPDFDYEELSTYYDYADNCISLELVQETVKYKRKK